MRRAACVVLLLALAGNARAGDFEFQALPEDPAGPRVVIATRELPVAVLLVHFASGAVADGPSPGLTRLTQQMMLRNNRRLKYGALLEELHASAATLTMETGLHGSDFLLVAPSAEFPQLAKKLLELTLTPQLLVPQLRKAIDFAARDTRALPEAAESVQDIARSLIQDALFQNDPYGDRSSLEGITKAQLQQHLAGPMSAANATVVALGGFDPAQFELLVSGFKGGRRVSSEPPKLTLPVATRGLARSHVHLLGYGVTIASPRDRAVTRVIAAVLEDSVREELRDRGALHGCSAALVHRPWLDAITLLVATPGRPVAGLASLLNRRVAALREGKVDEAAFDRNRRHVLARLRALDRDPVALAAELSAVDADLEWLGAETVQAVESLTFPQFTEAARGWLREEARFGIEFGPPGSGQAAAPELKQREGEVP